MIEENAFSDMKEAKFIDLVIIYFNIVFLLLILYYESFREITILKALIKILLMV